MTVSTEPAVCHRYELQIKIEAEREQVWKALVEDINCWWLTDFYAVGNDSVIELDTKPGGRGLLESCPGGSWLLWYTVQMILPDQFAIYLVGHIAPAWGGPTVSSLKVMIEETANGSIFHLTDARHGRINETDPQSYQDGWARLFNDCLKKYVEQAS